MMKNRDLTLRTLSVLILLWSGVAQGMIRPEYLVCVKNSDCVFVPATGCADATAVHEKYVQDVIRARDLMAADSLCIPEEGKPVRESGKPQCLRKKCQLIE